MTLYLPSLKLLRPTPIELSVAQNVGDQYTDQHAGQHVQSNMPCLFKRGLKILLLYIGIFRMDLIFAEFVTSQKSPNIETAKKNNSYYYPMLYLNQYYTFLTVTR